MAGSEVAGEREPEPGGFGHPGLSHREVLASGGWHPRYARALITASDGDYGFALVDGNGDGAELEEELWQWKDSPGGHGRWQAGVPPVRDPWTISPRSWRAATSAAYFAYGRVPGAESVTIEFEQRRYEMPMISQLGVWGFIREAAGPHPGLPVLVS